MEVLWRGRLARIDEQLSFRSACLSNRCCLPCKACYFEGAEQVEKPSRLIFRRIRTLLTKPFEELQGVKRLRKVHVRAEVIGLEYIFVLGFSRKQDDRQVLRFRIRSEGL